MSTNASFPSDNAFQKKSFWKRPEGITGLIFLTGLVLGGGYLFVTYLDTLVALAANTLYLAGMLMALGAIVYMVLDPKMRNLVWYGYKSIMRKITGVFVQIDPIGILKSYVEDLQDNLANMSKQIGNLRGQMRKMSTLVEENSKELNNSLAMASMAEKKGDNKNMVLHARKAARLKETNGKYDILLQRMDILYKMLTRMYQNSEILIEDTKDQVNVKEQERKIIRTSHSAMTSAMSVISGDPDKRAMFDMALEAIADDVANKVGEMERFMELSSSFMDSVDLQNGVFEEQGLKMLEEYEKKSSLLLLADGKNIGGLDLNSEKTARPTPEARSAGGNQYNQLFD